MAQAAGPPATSGPGIYLHIPFCRARCGYCDFYSLVAPSGERTALVHDLLREIPLAAASGRFDGSSFATVFLGGGTPSLLTGGEMRRLLDGLRGSLALAPGAEVTVEANPESLTGARLAGYRRSGVNRISLGVQSLDPEELRLLERLHSAAQARDRVRRLRREGFSNLSLDLIYGIPGSTLARWRRTLEEALALAPEHLSAYLLTLEGEEPLARRLRQQGPPALAEEAVAEQYELLRELTAQAGLFQYEISNFARPGYESRHNRNYWLRGEYLGLGPSAHSHRCGRRWSNPSSLELYRRALKAGRLAWEEEEALTPLQAAEEWIFLGLRLSRGIPSSAVLMALPLDRRRPFEERVRGLAERGLLMPEQGWLRLHPRAFFISDAVFRELLDGLA